uniref:DRBM domain-containing protein n=1 Tax=Salix viminalis TaxID=40686 RepID=A0A6N2LAB1_SALVM
MSLISIPPIPSNLLIMVGQDMFKNQLQELAQRSCFNLPAYACIREGPDHAPRFRASVNFNGEIYEKHAAAEVALNVLSSRGPARSLTARVLDETGIYKNLLQETAHRAGLTSLYIHCKIRSYVPELAGMNFTGEPAKTKKQAEKNAAIATWSALKRMPNLDSLSNRETDAREEQDQEVVERVLSNFRSKDEGKHARNRDHNQARRRMAPGSYIGLLLGWLNTKAKPSLYVSPPPPPRTSSKILPPASHTDNPSLFTLNRPLPLQVQGKSLVQAPEIPVALEEHLKDEEEWWGTKSDVIRKPIEKDGARNSNSNSSSVYASSSIYRPFPFSTTGKPVTSLLDNTSQPESTRIRSRVSWSTNPSPMASTSIHIPRPMFTGGPPSPIRPPLSPSATNAPRPATTGVAEVSIFKNTAPNQTQLSSTEFKNKLQLSSGKK